MGFANDMGKKEFGEEGNRNVKVEEGQKLFDEIGCEAAPTSKKPSFNIMAMVIDDQRGK